MPILGNTEALASPPQPLPALPLFYTQPEILNVENYGKARLRADLNYSFAAAANLIPLSLVEMAEVATAYPIVFAATDPAAPLAVMGLEGANYFVDGQGAWSPRQPVPAYVRKYPFIFQEIAPQGELLLCVDAPGIDREGAGVGAPLYEDGKPSATARTALDFCAAFAREFQATRQMCEGFVRLGLVHARDVTVTLGNGRAIKLDGIASLDPEAFAALPARDILFLHQQGSLGMAYYMLQSQRNWRRLLELANDREAGNSSA